MRDALRHLEVEIEEQKFDGERWRKLEELFEATVDVRPERRDEILASCDDPELRAEVLRMLDGAAGDADPVAAAVGGAAVEFSTEEAAVGPRPGEQLGPYRLDEVLGEGGMGTVYRALRVDGEYSRQVAIKVVHARRGIDPELVSRLRTEREILARLEHPYIARLLDGGTTAAGAPYVVMEYVEGVPITQYCAQENLTAAERVRLFCKVCEAVQEAHRNLVIHRDLKPGNILVTPTGDPRLLDFGIAKLLDEEGDEAAQATRTQDRRLTPDYASPEQVLGEPATTASDVYSLGVVLYELLAGVRPFDTTETPSALYERVVAQVEPQPPSARLARPGSATSAWVTSPRALRGDLDQIVLQALRALPSRRYSAVELLRLDLERHLEGLPVSARPLTIGYQLSKAIRRHKESMVVAAVLLLALVGSTGYYVVEQRATRAVAEREAATARETAGFLKSLFEVSDPMISDGEDVTARQLLDEGAARLERDLEDRPWVQASLRLTIGDVYRSLGLLNAAEAQIEPATEQIRRLAEVSADLGSLVANSAGSLGRLRLDQGRFEDAEELFAQQVERILELPGDQQIAMAIALRDQGALAFQRGQYDRSIELHRASITAVREIEPDHPLVPENLSDIAANRIQQGRFAEAEDELRSVLDHLVRSGGPKRELGRAWSSLASAQMQQGRYEEALPSFRAALEARLAALGEEHFETLMSRQSLASLLMELGELDEAQTLLEAVIETNLRLYGPDSRRLGAPLTNYAALLKDRGELDAAVATYREAIRVHEVALGPEHPLTAHPVSGLAGAFVETGDFPSALPLLERVGALRAKTLGADHPRTLISQSALGYVLYLTGDQVRGRELMQSAAQALSARFDDDHVWVKTAWERLRRTVGTAGVSEGTEASEDSKDTAEPSAAEAAERAASQ